MNTYKNTGNNFNAMRAKIFPQKINSYLQFAYPKHEFRKMPPDQAEFVTEVLVLISTLQRKAEISDSRVLAEFFRLLRKQLARRKPNLEDIFTLIDNTRA